MAWGGIHSFKLLQCWALGCHTHTLLPLTIRPGDRPPLLLPVELRGLQTWEEPLEFLGLESLESSRRGKTIKDAEITE